MKHSEPHEGCTSQPEIRSHISLPDGNATPVESKTRKPEKVSTSPSTSACSICKSILDESKDWRHCSMKDCFNLCCKKCLNEKSSRLSESSETFKCLKCVSKLEPLSTINMAPGFVEEEKVRQNKISNDNPSKAPEPGYEKDQKSPCLEYSKPTSQKPSRIRVLAGLASVSSQNHPEKPELSPVHKVLIVDEWRKTPYLKDEKVFRGPKAYNSSSEIFKNRASQKGSELKSNEAESDYDPESDSQGSEYVPYARKRRRKGRKRKSKRKPFYGRKMSGSFQKPFEESKHNFMNLSQQPLVNAITAARPVASFQGPEDNPPCIPSSQYITYLLPGREPPCLFPQSTYMYMPNLMGYPNPNYTMAPSVTFFPMPAITHVPQIPSMAPLTPIMPNNYPFMAQGVAPRLPELQRERSPIRGGAVGLEGSKREGGTKSDNK